MIDKLAPSGEPETERGSLAAAQLSAGGAGPVRSFAVDFVGQTENFRPESVVARRKSPDPSTQDPAYEQALRDRLRDLLDDPDAPLLPLLDTVHAERRAVRPGGGAPPRAVRG
jgi:hypothetical protein